ncbi:MAG: tetratricopeptide repeat protein [Chthoniobacterales bacterium]
MSKQVRRVRRKRRRDRPSPRARGRLLIYAAALIIGFGFGTLCLTYAPRAYSSWRETRLLKRATASLEKKDFTGARDTAQQMLRIRPDSLAAFQILAEATEKESRPETVAWRAQIARLLPRDLDAELNLASAALRFGQLDVARRALEKIPEQDRDKAAYHVVAGWLARAQGNDADVEAHFAAAVKQEPANDLYQFNFAVLQIRSADSEKNSAARATLERLSKMTDYRAGSLRALLTDAVQRNDLERADHLAQDLQMSQQATFGDFLLCLDFYRKLDQKKINAVLGKVKPVAARDPRDVAALMEWMNRNGLATEVLKWNEKLPSDMTSAPPAAVPIAEAFAEVKNWSRLKRWTRGTEWGDSEYLRLAYQAYSARQGRQSSAANAEFDSLWQSADRATADHPDREAILARLVTKWNLPGEAKALWKRVAKNAPMRREALDAEFKIARASNDLPELLEISKQLHESSPRESPLTANYARLALLLAPTTEEAQQLAKEAYDTTPNELNTAVTYAFALYNKGRTSEGLEILRKLPPDELTDPHAAAYTAVLLLDENQSEAAREFVEAAQKGPLYGEEKKLLTEALAKAAAATPTPAPSEPPTPPPAVPPSPND